ncbi:Basic-leucine zipper (BZIP) transcription factor domain-containing protein [Fasciolopsis buskii]|uniref:Basic-leucine zipper (BZIP) transcription factor domain-containing protein n=1 Tax=Fasciolopsis buskii TaxID=27845 RepID=A0A8E0S2U6_9TREM|nr:Basic-leucine zipper (BZIP) transcription factor domain-containing protein [Fasciolopsis buski]
MGFEVTDDELVRMSTSELRLLLAKRQLTPEEHRQLRSRRRRLQNRKYARKCAHKKLTEVENLTTEVEEETTELQALRRQLFRINLTTQRLQHQATELARFRLSLQSQNSANPNARTIRMLLSDGITVGFAQPVACPPQPVCSALLRAPAASSVSIGPTTQTCRDNVRPISLLLNSHSLCSAPSSSSCSFSSSQANMPVQLAAGLGMPSNQNPSPYAWSQSASSSLNSRLPMRLVRPVGCGIVTNGRNRAEY